MSSEVHEHDPPWLVVALGELAAARTGGEARRRMMVYAARSEFQAADDDDQSPFGAAFVNWALAQVGMPHMREARPRAWMAGGHRLDRPVRGCIAVLSQTGNANRATAGFLLAEEHDTVQVLTATLDRVQVQRLPLAWLLGYRMPAGTRESPPPTGGPERVDPGNRVHLQPTEDLFKLQKPSAGKEEAPVAAGPHDVREPEGPGDAELPAPDEDGHGEQGGWEESPPPPDKTSSATPPAERYVGTGFAPRVQGLPHLTLQGDITLVAGERYWFWLEIGSEPLPDSIETVHTPFPHAHLQAGTQLTVVLFSLPGGLVPDPEASTGELRVDGDGVRVHRQPAAWPPEALAGNEVLRRRLLFPVRAPGQPGTATLRCSIYHGQTLVQSRLVHAQVTAEVETSNEALASTLDYTLSRTLRPGYLQSLPDHRLSLMLNRNEDGSHGFFFKGQQEFRSTAVLGELQVQGMIDRARKAMRKAAWGGEDEWTPAVPYRYQDGAVNTGRLRDDLLTLAVNGMRLYHRIASQLADGRERAIELRRLMQTPGQVQIVNKMSPSHLLPASLFYDYDELETGAPASAEFLLCPEFVRALGDDTRPLEEQPCFQGRCPSQNERRVVCPSGFWGFRHELGMPVSVLNAPEAPVSIGLRGAPAFAMAVYRDFDLRQTHEQRLRGLAQGWAWEYADTYDETLQLLGQTRSQVLYFYCHGGFSNDAPYLQVGGADEGLIHPESLDWDLRWTEPRPLVFINGCRTVAVAPEQAFEFVRSLVETHNAAGVIGTEITVFEPLASQFAEEFFDRFLVRRRPLGESVRGARLALLKRGNPLGLVYVPFALAGLHLE